MTGTGRAVFYGVLLGTALTSVLANAGDSDTVSNTSVVPNDGTADAGANGTLPAPSRQTRPPLPLRCVRTRPVHPAYLCVGFR
jgi:hypothetical protein